MRALARTALSLGVAGLLLAACGDDTEESTDTTTETTAGDTTGTAAGDETDESDVPAPDGEAAACAEGNTTNDGVLTIGTDSPAFPPWFVNDDPTNGQGFESAVAYAVAEQLGFGPDAVEWITVPFNNSFAPGDKEFDFNINQVSITAERAEAVDFSDGYYDVNQAIVAPTDSAAVGVTDVEGLRGLRFGAQIGTTSLAFIEDVIQPETEPFVYNDNAGAKAALDAGQIDAIVLDLPTAFFVSAVEIEGTAVIGQFPAADGESEQFGLVLEKDSPLTECVNLALTALRESGELDAIEQEWLSDVVEAPVIEIG